ncbi:hypothetical protein SAMN04488072_101139 [Lentibacillus halodurans]|uniref:LysM domain-containing protein n=1 Tax=Lentibacillus halodurans TaxID=237679 RepID=A0A1I0V340_9BACI|nr:hypothetical protein [Lentibacillus halodurans]SFA70701.1 hypothetical protein SAMN04488072_101139 [Lentibacillus halodurans]
MNSIKKLLLYTFIILFLISVHQDLTVGTPLNNNLDSQNNPPIVEQENITFIKVQTNTGDTVLSIVEELNKQNNNDLDISQILDDFKALNPGVEPLHIQTGEYYYFPLY